jgi:hypothetical protein
VGTVGNDRFIGGQSFSSSFTTSSNHTAAFGVVDLNDTAVRSLLSIDQVQISTVPEADARNTLLAGMDSLVLLMKRRKGQSTNYSARQQKRPNGLCKRICGDIMFNAKLR